MKHKFNINGLLMNKEENKYQADLINMVLGGLIALKSEQQIGSVSYSPGSETIFLGKWLKVVKKQRRYPKSVSENIDNFLMLYTAKGRSADLSASFSQIYNEYRTAKISSQNFEGSARERFDKAMDILKEKSWSLSLPLDEGAVNGTSQSLKDKELFVIKKNWDDIFDEQGELNRTLSFCVTSTAQEAIDSLYLQGFLLVKDSTQQSSKNSYLHYNIFPKNSYTGNVVIPSQYKD